MRTFSFLEVGKTLEVGRLFKYLNCPVLISLVHPVYELVKEARKY